MQIGTLAVCLPSLHSGGDVCFPRSGEKQQFDTAQSSEFDCSVFSWFSDVAMELRPITLGCRLMLVYSIVQPRKGCLPSAELIQGMRQEFFEALDMWKNEHESSEREVPGILAVGQLQKRNMSKLNFKLTLRYGSGFLSKTLKTNHSLFPDSKDKTGN